MLPGILNADALEAVKFKRERLRGPVYAIAGLGLLINVIYFGIIFATGAKDGRAGFWENISEHLFIASLLIIFPLVAFLVYRIMAGYRLSDYSKRLELEMEARNKQLLDLMSFNENIMDSVNDLIFVIGSDGRFQFVGGNCGDILGCEPSALVGHQFIELVAPGSVARAVNSFESVLRGLEVPPYELEVVNDTGENRFIEISSTSYSDEQRVSAQVGVARDVTERKRLEQHVVERNRELAALNAVATAVGQSLDLDQVLGSALDQVAALMRVEKACVYLYDGLNSELELRAFKGASASVDKSQRIKLGDTVLGQAAEQRSPILINSNDNPEETAAIACEDEIASVAAIPMQYSGRLVGVLGLASDEAGHFSRADIDLMRVVSSQIAMAMENALLFEDSRKKARELAERNRELALATDELSNLIAVAEQERSFSVRSKNHHLVKCWEIKDCAEVGCPSYKSENRRCWQVAGTHCGGEVQGVFAQKFGQCEKCEVFRLARPDRLTELGEAFNNMMAMLEQTAEEQQQLQEQLVQSSKLAAIGELAANIAHEINNPLTGVLGHTVLLSRSLPEEDPSVENLHIIENETMRARDIVRNLLDFSRQESLSMKKASIKKIMDDTLTLLRKQAELANVEIRHRYEEDIPAVHVDVNQMKQIFVNILNNAIHAMQAGGLLTIGIKAVKPDGRRPWVEVSFSDTGKGIPPEMMARVFDPFFTSKDPGEGTGLGLSISRRIVEEHGGSIDVVSEVGKGSTFTVKLPTANITTDIKHVA